MTDRVPLIVDTSTSRIAELQVGDNLDLGNSNIVNVNQLTATVYYGDGSQLTGISANPGGSTTQLQYNNSGSFGGIANVTYDGSNISLGPVGFLKISGGSSGQVLTTDGAGNLSFTTSSGGGGSGGFEQTFLMMGA